MKRSGKSAKYTSNSWRMANSCRIDGDKPKKAVAEEVFAAVDGILENTRLSLVQCVSVFFLRDA